MINRTLLVLGVILMSISCDEEKVPSGDNPESVQTHKGAIFQKVNGSESGITFSNSIVEDYNYNILNYEYLYNGGGVAIGDINNDDLPDIYFSGTFAPNKLYLNKGDMKFEDISESAGVSAKVGFKTGVTMADINADGWLDIHVCRTSKEDNGQKDNLVFLNNGDLTFTESAQALGLKDNSNSNHANFFDYDLDGDLDMYLLNHRLGFKEAVKLDLQQNADGTITRKVAPRTPFESDRLYRNDGGRFTDVSKEAGVINSSFGLSATVSDLNKDGFPDVYVANDYIEPDYVYMNNGDGTFTDRYETYVRHSSQNSMGCDISDFNNDGHLDFMVLDMVAEDHIRYKELMNVMQLERYETLLKYGYGHQVGRNVLQMNNGNGTFSEIGQIAGVSNTDWSWSTFFADFDNDGFKDLFITNGYKRDVTNLDYMNYTRDSIEQSGGVTMKRYPDINDFLTNIPQEKLQNYTFKNNGDVTFTNVSDAWGINDKTFSNGAAYADLDNDGDIDLVVNNIDQEASVYKNQAGGNFIQLSFSGYKKNIDGLGVNATLYMSDGTKQYQELTANRGFFSASQPILHFGLGSQSVNRMVIKWPDGRIQNIENPEANKRTVIDYKNAKPGGQKNDDVDGLFESGSVKLQYVHKENNFMDFNRDRLLPHKLSRFGPCVAVGDVNGDGAQDLFLGNAAGGTPSIMLQGKNGFKAVNNDALGKDSVYEDTDAIFFDADGDADLDLYVVSGGNVAKAGAGNYQDRLYINNNGTFSKSTLPPNPVSGSCAAVHDIDDDGDFDLIVGGRHVPGQYPKAAKTTVLINNGRGQFMDATPDNFKSMGMVTDLEFVDVDGDNKKELVVSGEWMPLKVFSVNGGSFKDITSKSGMDNTEGWWNAIEFVDVDKDGDLDIVAGNLGLNTRHKASKENPIGILSRDFDNNDALESVLTYDVDGKTYPYAGLDALVKQMPKIKKTYKRYGQYARATVEDIFGPAEVEKALHLEAYTLKTSIFLNDGKGMFVEGELPIEAQLSQIHDIASGDFNKDGKIDILLVGNDHGAETETGISDASNGELFLGNGDGTFNYLPNRESALWLSNEVRDVVQVKMKNGKTALVVGNNNTAAQVYSW